MLELSNARKCGGRDISAEYNLPERKEMDGLGKSRTAGRETGRQIAATDFPLTLF